MQSFECYLIEKKSMLGTKGYVVVVELKNLMFVLVDIDPVCKYILHHYILYAFAVENGII
jgi:hypothetical protein